MGHYATETDSSTEYKLVQSIYKVRIDNSSNPRHTDDMP